MNNCYGEVLTILKKDKKENHSKTMYSVLLKIKDGDIERWFYIDIFPEQCVVDETRDLK